MVGAEGRGLCCSLTLKRGGPSHPVSGSLSALGCPHPARALPTPPGRHTLSLTLSGRNLPHRPDRFSLHPSTLREEAGLGFG